MAQASKTGIPGSRFVLLMLLILVFMVLLVFTIRKHPATQPNVGPPANEHLQH